MAKEGPSPNEIITKATKKLEEALSYINSNPEQYKEYHDKEKPTLADIIMNKVLVGNALVTKDEKTSELMLAFPITNEGSVLVSIFSEPTPMYVYTGLDSSEIELEVRELSATIQAYFCPSVLFSNRQKELENACAAKMKEYEKERVNATKFMAKAQKTANDAKTPEKDRAEADETMKNCMAYMKNFNVSGYETRQLRFTNKFTNKEEIIFLAIPKVIE